MGLMQAAVVKPEIGELKELKVPGVSLSEVVERQGRKGWHVADGRHGTDNITDKFRKSHVLSASEQGSTGGQKTVSPSGSVTVENHTLSTSQMPSHRHSVYKTTGGGISTGGNVMGATGGNGTDGNDVLYAGSTGAHNHGGVFTGVSQDNEPQHIIVLLLQYTGQKVIGVLP